MNINQAKNVAGIKYNLATREDHVRAERDCVKLIVSARRAADDARAAELSEAKTVFQKRTRGRNCCAVCGVTIARGATRCRIHSRPQSKMIAAPIGLNPTEGHKGGGNANAVGNKGNARVAIADDAFTSLGYYAVPIQKIIAKWRGTIGEDELKQYFFAVAFTVIHRRRTEFKFNQLGIAPDHWQAFFELGTVIAKFYANKQRPHAWLLGVETATNGKFESWEEVRARIIKQGGPAFRESALRKASHDLKLSASKESKTFFRHFAVLVNQAVTKTG
jgi:hypothetical protein